MRAMVLLIENDAGERELVKTGLASGCPHCSFGVAESSLAAIELLKGLAAGAVQRPEGLPALVVINLELVEQERMELLRWMRSHRLYRYVAVLAYTRDPDPQRIRFARDAGADCCLTRHPEDAEFLQRIASVSQQRAAEYTCFAEPRRDSSAA